MNYQIPSKILSFDCESAGLNGPVFAVGYVIIEDGIETKSDYLSSGIAELAGETSQSDLRWLHENTPMEILYPATTEGDSPNWTGSHKHLREWFQKVLKEHNDALIITDCGYPVETGFLHNCEALVYPLIDVTGVLLAKGVNPVETFSRFPSELPRHHPVNDARQSARVFLEHLSK